MPVIIMQYHCGAPGPWEGWLRVGRALASRALLPGLQLQMVRVYNAIKSKQGVQQPNRLSPPGRRKMLRSRGHAVDAVELRSTVPS